MLRVKILNGYNMSRMNRYDAVYNEYDDRLEVYIIRPGGKYIRVCINNDGTTESERVTGTPYDAPSVDGLGTTEITVRANQ